MSVESVKQGECLMMDDRPRSVEERLEGFSPSEASTDKLSICLEQGPLQIHSSLEDFECLSDGGIRQNTTPIPEGPLKESENSCLENETSQSLRVNVNCKENLDCDSIRVNEITREKYLEPKPSVETQLSCYSKVDETTLGGTLSMEECRVYSQLHCTEETDSDSFNYDAEDRETGY